MKLIDERTRDGSRHFASLSHAVSWGSVCDHVSLLPGAEMVSLFADGPGRAWLDFRFHRHRFSIKSRDGHFRLFVADPQCPDLILYQVGCHFERLLEKACTDDAAPPDAATDEDAD
jgi:hypothetical protein